MQNKLKELYLDLPMNQWIIKVFLSFSCIYLLFFFLARTGIGKILFDNIWISYGSSAFIITFIFSILDKLITHVIINYKSFLKSRNHEIKNENTKITSPFKIFNPNDMNIDNFSLPRNDQIKIFRELLQKNLYSSKNPKCILLTAESGSGKTTLLKILKQRLEKYENKNDILNFEIEYIRDYKTLNDKANNILQCNKHNVKKLIIFDQFERIFKDKNLLKKKKDIINSLFCELPDNSIIVFSFLKEFLSDVLTIINKFNLEDQIMLLQYSNEDYKKIISNLCNCLSIDETFFDSHDIDKFYNQKVTASITYSLIKRMRSDNTNLNEELDPSSKNKNNFSSEIPLIGIILMGIILTSYNSAVLLKWKELSENSQYRLEEFIIGKYIGEIINKSENQTLSKMILYALVKQLEFNESLDIKDLCHITYATKKNILDMLNYLKTNCFIIEKKESNYVIDEEKSYEIIHEFLAKKIQTYCVENLSPNIMNNIDYYIVNKINHSNFTNKFTLIYNNYLTSISFLNRLLPIALATFFLINTWNFIYSINSLNDYLFLSAINLLAGISTYYNYNYSRQFLIAVGRRYLIIPLICAILIALLLAFPFQWGICFGFAIILQSITLLTISPKKFATDIFVFLFVGSFITFQGFHRSSMGYNNEFELITWIILYFIFISFAILRHINPDYLLFKLGEANLK